jgi:hypothetical protein
LLAFATFLSVDQSQRMIRETRRDVSLQMVRNWAKEGLKSLSGWQPNTLQKILETIEADGFTADVTAREISSTLESNVRAAVACCVTLRVSVEQSTGLLTEADSKVDQLKQHLMRVIDISSQRQS